jgi:phosphonate transport system permease protein
MASEEKTKKLAGISLFFHTIAKKWKHLSDAIWYTEKTIDISARQDGMALRSIKKKRPLAPIIALTALVAFFCLSLLTLNADNFKVSFDGVREILGSLFTLDPTSLKSLGTMDRYNAYMWGTAVPLIWQTTEMCFIATVIGAVISIPIYYLAAHNVAKNPVIYQPVRIVNDLIRTLPTMLLAIFAEFIWGLNSLSGIFAMIVFTVGIMYQLMYEYIETLEMSPFEAISSAGGRTLQNVHLGLHPETKPVFFADFLYTFEINIRASVVLGYVGAGGFGYEMEQRIEQEQYDRVGCLLIPLFILVCVLQLTTNIISRKMK